MQKIPCSKKCYIVLVASVGYPSSLSESFATVLNAGGPQINAKLPSLNGGRFFFAYSTLSRSTSYFHSSSFSSYENELDILM